MIEDGKTANPEKVRNKMEKALVILVLDISGSMAGTPVDQLNDGIYKMKEYILNDPSSATQMELAIVTYHDYAEITREFDLVLPEHEFPRLVAGGTTNLVEGMNKAIEMARDRKNWLKSNSIRYYRPIIALITDGHPTNTEEDIEILDEDIQDSFDDKGIFLLPFGVGDHADYKTLLKIAHTVGEKDPVVYKMTDFDKFGELFQFLSASAGAAVDGGGKASPILSPDVAVPITIDMDLTT
jgi:uncharacterized protein YegL